MNRTFGGQFPKRPPPWRGRPPPNEEILNVTCPSSQSHPERAGFTGTTIQEEHG